MNRIYRLKSDTDSGGLVPLPGEEPRSTKPSTGAAPANVVSFPGPARSKPAAAPARSSFAAGLPSSLPQVPAPAPAAAESRADSHYPRTTDRQALSKKEITVLGILAGKAWAAFLRSDPAWLPDMLAAGNKKGELEKNWRHSQCRAATLSHEAGAISGISSARRAHYNTLAAHFAGIAGEDLRSFDSTMRDGPAKFRAGADGDRQEDVRQARAVLDRTMKDTGLGPAYVAKVIAGKFKANSLDQLTRKQLWQLVFTLKNRATARDGGGSVKGRNKSQGKTVRPVTPF